LIAASLIDCGKSSLPPWFVEHGPCGKMIRMQFAHTRSFAGIARGQPDFPGLPQRRPVGGVKLFKRFRILLFLKESAHLTFRISIA
jgi:hypothetical protein